MSRKIPVESIFAFLSSLALGLIVNVLPVNTALSQEIDIKSLLTGGAKIDIENDPDEMRRLQSAAMVNQNAEFGRWGHLKDKYSTWVNHSNRLIPMYTFGLQLDALRQEGSAYTSGDSLAKLYGVVPEATVNSEAEHFDQTDIYRLQVAVAQAGYKHIIVMVFDGMDWQTTQAAAAYKNGKVLYQEGRGKGLAFQDYRGVKTDFGLVCTSAKLSAAKTDVNSQTVLSANDQSTGGYDINLGGANPWSERGDHNYLMGLDRKVPHTVTDSAASASSLFSGIKTYNGSINYSADGKKKLSIARQLQRDHGFRVGAVTSVPISHATIAGAYANNVTRKDYQDITRDLLGLPSSSHRRDPLPGMDVLIGGGWGEEAEQDKYQGDNYLAGNKYLHDEDLKRLDVAGGGDYVVAQRQSGVAGRKGLLAAANKAAEQDKRLLGFYGVGAGHLPFQTADGQFDPTIDAKGTEEYSADDVAENPTLADMTDAALTVLEDSPNGFWLLVEAGDVDWANHANNIDSSIGAVLSGEAAFNRIVKWVESKDAWGETALIVTADHGHYFVMQDPEVIANAGRINQFKADQPTGETRKEVPPK
ncbi:Alkaline phosphatase H precursor [Planctomycetes bacterium K23_9]|uniref:Alkaline phosphatase H n=2 Tax=Stieleria marina TaxID=1930275 RepID=A0A517NU47_9BACT|nr:Alkaline phosphatase H precursor [Planctomycetes bacterium K23_9]